MTIAFRIYVQRAFEIFHTLNINILIDSFYVNPKIVENLFNIQIELNDFKILFIDICKHVVGLKNSSK